MSRTSSFASLNGWTTLLKGNLLIKILALLFFAFIARLFSASEVVIYALIPSISILLASLSGFGLSTLSEKYGPSLSEPERSSYLVGALSIQLLGLAVAIGISFLMFGYWAKALSIPADWISRKVILHLSLFLYGATYLAVTYLNILGSYSSVNTVRLVLEILNKIIPIIFYFLSFASVLEGYLIAQVIAFILAFIKLKGTIKTLSINLKPVFSLLRKYPSLYFESIFNSLRTMGDNIIVSFVLGEILLSQYFIFKRISEQLEPIGNALVQSSIQSFSKIRTLSSIDRIAALDTILRSYAFSFMQLSFIYAPVCLILVYILAGKEYVQYANIAGLLAIHFAFNVTFSMQMKIVLNFFRPVYRLVLSASSFGIYIFLLLTVFNGIGLWGAALSLLCSDVLMLMVSTILMKRVGVENRRRVASIILQALGLSVILIYVNAPGSITDVANIASLLSISFVFLAIGYFNLSSTQKNELHALLLRSFPKLYKR